MQLQKLENFSCCISGLLFTSIFFWLFLWVGREQGHKDSCILMQSTPLKHHHMFPPEIFPSPAAEEKDQDPFTFFDRSSLWLSCEKYQLGSGVAHCWMREEHWKLWTGQSWSEVCIKGARKCCWKLQDPWKALVSYHVLLYLLNGRRIWIWEAWAALFSARRRWPKGCLGNGSKSCIPQYFWCLCSLYSCLRWEVMY